jgi:pimeloyl-ACP methyl ester carboxylesterase
VPNVAANGIEVEYTTRGDQAHPALLLISGVNGQMTFWDEQFVVDLAERGFYVISFDNRDVGLSSWFDAAGCPDLASVAATGRIPPPAYRLDDMADDASGLLDHLGVERAHIVGVSMGGMIAQTFAIRYPHRTRSLVSVMSTTGNPAVGAPRRELIEALIHSRTPVNRDEALDGAVAGARLTGSPGYPFEESRIRGRAGADYDRAFHPAGAVRQTLAVLNQPDRTADLVHLAVATLVIHGEADPVVDPSGGRATAEAVPGAELWMIPGMGHDLPVPLFAALADRIAANAGRGG